MTNFLREKSIIEVDRKENLLSRVLRKLNKNSKKRKRDD